jgi:hypothetical protein
MNNEKIIDLLKKIKALADKGVDEEEARIYKLLQMAQGLEAHQFQKRLTK